MKQAGQSRAKLKIYSGFSSNFPLRTHKSRSIQWLLGYSTPNNFFCWRSPSFWVIQKYDLASLSFKFDYDQISRCWDIPLFIFWGRLHLKDLYIIVWSSKLKFKVWVGSHKWLLRYSTFNILRSSSMGCHLHLKYWSTLLKV